MHDVIENELEDYLGGTASRAFHAHLEQCEGCRGEVRAMSDVSGLFSALQAEPEAEIAPGFYFRVSQRIESQRKDSFWSVFSFDPAFARRLVFSSLMALALLGVALVSRESGLYPLDNDRPSVIMAQHDVSEPHDDSSDRGRMLVTLASYQH